jgi:hypothetical protein
MRAITLFNIIPRVSYFNPWTASMYDTLLKLKIVHNELFFLHDIAHAEDQSSCFSATTVLRC